MKSLKEIDPEAFQLLGDETRRKIIHLLRVKELTVSQISAELGVTPQNIYHHIKKLEKAGLVEVTREERIGHLIESYYQTTAETFIASIGALRGKTATVNMLEVLNGLKKLGFKIKADEEIASQLAKMEAKAIKCECAERLEEDIVKLKDTDFMTQEMIMRYADLLTMSDKEFAEKQKLNGKVRQLLLSICLEKPKIFTLTEKSLRK